jgi:hypothetical protein
MPEIRIDVAIFNLLIGQRGVFFRIPIDDALAAIDQVPFLYRRTNISATARDRSVIQREARARPIAGLHRFCGAAFKMMPP